MHNPIVIVWFKRDLRVIDHAPLVAACAQGAVLPLFCWEPSVWSGPDYAKQHQTFVQECLADLAIALQTIGLTLQVSNAGIIETLTKIASQLKISAIYSHEETGNLATFQVDKTVASWCKLRGIHWDETPQNGVVRRLKSRNEWNKHWERRMTAPQYLLPVKADPAPYVNLPQMPMTQAAGIDKPKRQKGGRFNALETFNSFLDGRAAQFRGGISSPLTAVTAGSRLSPYLAYGCLSMREVVQATRARQLLAKQAPHKYPSRLQTGLIGFESRLHWHCHFMQKLESEPEMEFANLHHAHDGMRDESLSDAESQRRLQAWSSGQTGWPLVDACMAMLRQTGWINFRMRAMLMSTASYLYWLHWRESGLHLAREFLDYEPGIHWPQTQMQSGTTGINTLRIYSPIKQAQDQDPTGAFVRHWLPALKNVPDTWIFEPYLMPKAQQLLYGCELDKHYPAPLVDIGQATRIARANITAARNKEGTFSEKQAVIKKHASRKGMLGSTRDKNGVEINNKKRVLKSKASKQNAAQQELL
ncbi:MAG: deoxyribodipyrimidine photo-lyase [Bdellovibrio sp.]|nr:deoxyribodipyrimidine photo-lyase [Methylotenera sp.]